jgi:hypothetical protein
MGVRDEFPTQSRIYLTRRLPETYLSPDDRRLVGDAAWLDEVRPQAERLIAAGDPRQARALMAERRGPQGRSLLPALEIEALEAIGDLPSAIVLARDERRAASIANDPSEVTTYTLHLARLLERNGEISAAETALGEALRTVRAPTVDRLRVLVAQIGVCGGEAACSARTGPLTRSTRQPARKRSSCTAPSATVRSGRCRACCVILPPR